MKTLYAAMYYGEDRREAQPYKSMKEIMAIFEGMRDEYVAHGLGESPRAEVYHPGETEPSTTLALTRSGGICRSRGEAWNASRLGIALRPTSMLWMAVGIALTPFIVGLIAGVLS